MLDWVPDAAYDAAIAIVYTDPDPDFMKVVMVNRGVIEDAVAAAIPHIVNAAADRLDAKREAHHANHQYHYAAGYGDAADDLRALGEAVTDDD